MAQDPALAEAVAEAVLAHPGVARMSIPLPRLAEELAAAVTAVLGPVAVDVTVADVETAAPGSAEVAVGRGAGLA